MKEHWDGEADRWLAWARTPGHDSYWRFHRDRFLRLLPPPTGPALDMGCGEGRLPRDLKARGYEVIGIDASPTLIEHARAADPVGDYRVADAADLPFDGETFALVVAFMSLHDVDEMPRAVAEAARVLRPGGQLCAAIVHPINSAGVFPSTADDATFTITDSYLTERPVGATAERDGLTMSFRSVHRPLQAYLGACSASGLSLEQLVEVPDSTAEPGSRWQRIPLFLHLRARRG